MSGTVATVGENRFFTTQDGVRLHYVEAGSGQPLVMLPGWSQSAAMFRFQIAALSSAYRVIAVDPRGHGDSDKPAFGYNAHRMAADVRDLILGLDLRDINLLGHSGGVKYVWAYSELYGADRLRKLVIVDDSPRLVDNPAWTEEQRAEIGPMYFTGDLDRFSTQLLASDGEAFTATAMRSMFSPAFAEREPQLMDWIVAENLKMPRALAMELLYATSGIDWRGTIKRITLPTLVIGAEGSTHKASVLTWIARQIPGAELRIFGRDEGGSHFMFIENPERFNQELARFLA